MAASAQEGNADARTYRLRWSWLVLALGVCAVLALTLPASAAANEGLMEVASTALDQTSDCDQDHSDVRGHCHASTACFAYAKIANSEDPFDFQPADHPLPASPDALNGRTPTPNLQPPKRIIRT